MMEAKANIDQALEQLRNEGITPDEAAEDFEELQEKLGELEDFRDRIEDLPDDERARAIFDKMKETTDITNKYANNPELDEVWKTMEENLDQDGIDNPTPQQIEERFIQDRAELYAEAENKMDAFKNGLYTD